LPFSFPTTTAKGVKKVERPELTFRLLAILLKDKENLSSFSYDDVWQFENLIK
jgi:hypothetical protein